MYAGLFEYSALTLNRLVKFGMVQSVVCQSGPGVAFGQALQPANGGHAEDVEAAEKKEDEGGEHEAGAQQPGQDEDQAEEVQENLLVGECSRRKEDPTDSSSCYALPYRTYWKENIGTYRTYII